jgi:hypothetical protein
MMRRDKMGRDKMNRDMVNRDVVRRAFFCFTRTHCLVTLYLVT